MGKFRLDDRGIEKIRYLLEHQVMQTEKKLAESAFYFFVNFGYHSVTVNVGPFKTSETEQGWSEYYAANWNVGIDGPNFTVIQPERQIDEEGDKYIQDLLKVKNTNGYINAIDSANMGQSIFVTNSVYYGKWLNDGGFLEPTYTKESQPNHFLELCDDYVRNNVKKIITVVAKECPSI